MASPANTPIRVINPAWASSFGVLIRSPFQRRIDSLLLKLRIEPADPIDNNEPAEPSDRIEPADPIDRIEPADPTEAIEPADPIDDNEATELSDMADTADAAEWCDR